MVSYEQEAFIVICFMAIWQKVSKDAKPKWKIRACGGRDSNPGSTALLAERGRLVGVAPSPS